MLDELNLEKLKIDEFQTYIKKKPQSSYEAITRTLSKCQNYIDLFDSQIGQILLSDLMPMIQERIGAVIDGKITDEARIELKVMLNLMNRWNKMVSDYNKNCEIVRKTIIA